ncbi:phosphotransferase family protein [Alloalcanivorax balearicus]|uniref:phosphotransferase family protein n=1 Tax=Alloalcanivorax balearicus TaxID=413232 RepID=UPI0021CD32A8|nr:phosphotransferase family protein [Alloalcanivorax balearicus]
MSNVTHAVPTAHFHDDRHQHPQDWQRLASYLRGQGLSFDSDTPPRQFAAGFGNFNYLIRVDGQWAVLRRPPPGPIPPGANDMARESLILSRLPKAYPLAPRTLHYCEDSHVLGARFFIMEYRAGLSIGGQLPEAVQQSWHGEAPVGEYLGTLLIRLLADLHAIPPEQVGLDSLGKPDGFIRRTLDGWTQRARLAWENDLPMELVQVIEWLEQRIPADQRHCFIHNDFKLDNVLLRETDLSPVAVIDWDMGTRGAPLYDLAVLLSYWTERGDPPCMHALGQMPTAGNGFPSREQAAAHYQSLTGVSLTSLHFFRVLALLRSAVVFQQIHRRRSRDEKESGTIPDFEQLARELSSFTLEVTRGRYY